MIHKADLLDRVHSPLKKALSFGERAVALGVTAKGLWDVGSKIVQGARALAPAAAALL